MIPRRHFKLIEKSLLIYLLASALVFISCFSRFLSSSPYCFILYLLVLSFVSFYFLRACQILHDEMRVYAFIHLCVHHIHKSRGLILVQRQIGNMQRMHVEHARNITNIAELFNTHNYSLISTELIN